MNKLSLGTKVFYEFRSGLIIPATIVEIQTCLTIPLHIAEKYNLVNKQNTSVWKTESENDSYCTVVLNEKDERGEFKIGHISISTEDESECISGTYFYWLDEPIGHEFPEEGMFLNLDAAMYFASKSKRRHRNHANKKLLAWRRMHIDSLTRQHIVAGGYKPEFPVYADKRVYVKR